MKYKYQITRRNPRRLRQFRPVWLCWKCAGRGKASESRWSYDAGHGQAAVMAFGAGRGNKTTSRIGRRLLHGDQNGEASRRSP